MPTPLAVTSKAVRGRPGWRAAAMTLLALLTALGPLAPARAGAQSPADSIARWTTVMQTGTLAVRSAALTGLAAQPIGALPTETRRVLVAELNRVHQALLTGGALGGPEEDESLLSDYYQELVDVVARFGTLEAALALAPAVVVSGGVARRVAQFGDAAVAALLPLLARRYNEMSVLETLGLVWFWADSTGSPLSDRSRAQIVAALTAAAGSGIHRDLLGIEMALLEIGDPAFLPLARQVRDFAASQGPRDRFTVVGMEDGVIPKLNALAAARTPASLANGLARMIAAVCGTDAAGRRNGVCHAVTNEVAAASNHLAHGRTTPARNVLEGVGKKLDQAYADGAFNAGEHALLAGNVTMLRQRLAP